MSLFVLDTDMLTLIEEGHAAASQRFLQQQPQDIAVTVLTIEEQLSGWYTELRKAKNPARLAWTYRRLASTVRFLSQLQILVYDEPAMQRYESLRKRNVKIGKMDLRIAATVLEHRGILVSRNSRDFKRVPDLPIEDWSQ